MSLKRPTTPRPHPAPGHSRWEGKKKATQMYSCLYLMCPLLSCHSSFQSKKLIFCVFIFPILRFISKAQRPSLVSAEYRTRIRRQLWWGILWCQRLVSHFDFPFYPSLSDILLLFLSFFSRCFQIQVPGSARIVQSVSGPADLNKHNSNLSLRLLNIDRNNQQKKTWTTIVGPTDTSRSSLERRWGAAGFRGCKQKHRILSICEKTV